MTLEAALKSTKVDKTAEYYGCEEATFKAEWFSSSLDVVEGVTRFMFVRVAFLSVEGVTHLEFKSDSAHLEFYSSSWFCCMSSSL